MKKSILNFVIVGVIAVSTTTAFGQENKKAKEARTDIKEAKTELRLAKKDSVADYDAFKKDAELRISINKKSIAELKTKRANDTKDNKAIYDRKVAALEQRNNDLQNRIDKAEMTETSKWASFKREFNHDMKELGHSIKDLGVDNAK
jgi:hypothetical protein